MNDDQQKPFFDDALPERLFGDKGEGSGEQTVHPILRTGPAAPSPYIVKLTSHAEDPVLDAYLIEDADIFADEAPLVEFKDGVLAILDDGLAKQLAESDVPVEMPKLAPYPAEAKAWDRAVPEDILLRAEPVDIFGDLLAEAEEEIPVDVVLPESELERMAELPVLAPELITSPIPVAAGTFRIEYADGTSADHEEDSMWSAPRTAPRTTSPTRGSREGSTARPVHALVHHGRHALAFSALAAILLLPLQAMQVFASAKDTQNAVIAEGKDGLSAFMRGATSLSSENFISAEKDFAKAADAFSSAKEEFDSLHGVVVAAVNVIPSTQRTAVTAASLIDMGERLSRASSLLSQAGEEISASPSLTVTDKIAVLRAYVAKALPEVEAAAVDAQKIDMSVIPADQREAVQKAVQTVPPFAASLAEFDRFADLLSMLLGADGKKQYLFAFQNNTELRATGGFIGSFSEMTFEDGALTKMIVPGGGTYDVQGQLKEFVAAPGPMQLLRARWEFQDANWFVDFPSTARKLLWFYEAAGGPTMDGVVAVNATMVERLLEAVGPVEMPAYGRTIDAENFLFETQKIVELEYDKTANTPKAFIGDLADAMFKKAEAADTNTLLRMIDAVGSGLSEREIQIYFSNNEAEALMSDVGWSGEIKETTGDFLMPVHTNLGGGKTDGVISEHLDVDVTIAEDGTIENTVTLTKTHHGMKNALFTGANNVDYLRLYVPRGSELISASGFEIPPEELFEDPEFPLATDEDLALAMQNVRKDPWSSTDIWDEQGKTVFGNWMQTAPGEVQEVKFTYRLPMKAFEDASGAWATAEKWIGVRKAVPYSLFVEKQSGVNNRDITVRVHVPEDFQAVWSSESETGETSVNFTGVKDDTFAGWLFERG